MQSWSSKTLVHNEVDKIAPQVTAVTVITAHSEVIPNRNRLFLINQDKLKQYTTAI
ncbi:MAG: hypothetical protein V7K92_04375 [Nostoc sp.]|uniref:hypothetical protein n=1 Tax=Nostoc sp. TaxID=1180 RepID=UPI002FEEFB7D